MYFSYICSDYHKWFVDMGYPRLDIAEHDDGSWSIIEYHNIPLIPCQTKWHQVLGPMRHEEKSLGFCERWVKKLDLKNKQAWDHYEEQTKKAESDFDRKENRALERIEQAHKVITNNPDLMNRVAKKGMQEIRLDVLSKYIPRYRF